MIGNFLYQCDKVETERKRLLRKLGKKLVLEGIRYDLRVILKLEFLQDVGPVRTDGFDAERQFGSDLFERFSTGQHDHDLVFTI